MYDRSSARTAQSNSCRGSAARVAGDCELSCQGSGGGRLEL